jgi:hypothetical protein
MLPSRSWLVVGGAEMFENLGSSFWNLIGFNKKIPSSWIMDGYSSYGLWMVIVLYSYILWGYRIFPTGSRGFVHGGVPELGTLNHPACSSYVVGKPIVKKVSPLSSYSLRNTILAFRGMIEVYT